MTKTYQEGGTVTITASLTTEDGCKVNAGDTGTLLLDMGDGDWLVHIPGKGSPLLNESQFKAE